MSGAAPVPLRPMSFGDILDGAFKLFRAQWRTMILAAGVVLAPVELVGNYAQRGALAGDLFEFFDPDPTEVPAFTDAEILPTLLVGFAVTVLVYPLLMGALARAAAGALLGEPVSPWGALAAGLRRWWALVVAWLLVLLVGAVPGIGGAGLMLAGAVGQSPPLVLLGVFVFLATIPMVLAVTSLFIAAAPAIAIEGVGPLRGLRRSARLLWPRFFLVVGVVVVTMFLFGVISTVLTTIPSLIGAALGETVGWIVVAAGALLASLVTVPFVACVATLLYFDGRVRREALDLDLVARRLGDDEGGSTEPDGLGFSRG
jgi:hypothetical protein